MDYSVTLARILEDHKGLKASYEKAFESEVVRLRHANAQLKASSE